MEDTDCSREVKRRAEQIAAALTALGFSFDATEDGQLVTSTHSGDNLLAYIQRAEETGGDAYGE